MIMLSYFFYSTVRVVKLVSRREAFLLSVTVLCQHVKVNNYHIPAVSLQAGICFIYLFCVQVSVMICSLPTGHLSINGVFRCTISVFTGIVGLEGVEVGTLCYHYLLVIACAFLQVSEKKELHCLIFSETYKFQFDLEFEGHRFVSHTTVKCYPR